MSTPTEQITATIDGIEVTVPKGTLIIRAAEEIGIAIPRFCDHPLLDPVAACRQCLVEVATPGPDGQLRPMPKPQPACAIEMSEGMDVQTQATSEVAETAQHAVMEFLLINHPLDCPVCDKGGECPLQNQAMSNGRTTSRYIEHKRTFAKPIKISSQVLLDRERCIVCQRCTRFSKEISGDPFIDLQHRGAQQQIGIYSPGVLGIATEAESVLTETGEPFASYFSGNTIQICPVGALTSAMYRFRSRPFDLVSTPGVCNGCSSGCAIRTDHRRGTVLRRQAGNDPQVNEEWICDKGRFAFHGGTTADRITTPLIREGGHLVPTSWPHALQVAALGLKAARDGGFAGDGSDTPDAVGAGVLVGGHTTFEDAYAYAKFSRTVLDTNDIDFRIRPHSAEEAAFLAHRVSGRLVEDGTVTFADLERASTVLLVALEPEEEVPVVFLRLRKAMRRNGTQVLSIAPFASRGLAKLGGQLLSAAPGTEPSVLKALTEGAGHALESGERLNAAARGLREEGAIILVGERAATAPGTFAAVEALARATGAKLAWVPRRSGERGAIEAGAMPHLLPGGRPVADAAARVDAASVWGVDSLPDEPGRSTGEIVEAAASAGLGALLVCGLDVDDLPDPARGLAALQRTFVVALEIRPSAAVDMADVVLPVAHASERSGAFLNWEGRVRTFPAALDSQAMTDLQVLSALAGEVGIDLRLPDLDAARTEIAQFRGWDGARGPAPQPVEVSRPVIAPGQAVLSTWHLLLDNGRSQVGEPYLAGTAHRPVVRLSRTAALRLGWSTGRQITVSTSSGSVTLPAQITRMPDGVVWLPTNNGPSSVRKSLRATSGDVVSVAVAEDAEAELVGAGSTWSGGATGFGIAERGPA
ncbi:MAG: NADH-quinone oxidoreductase subunit G [Micrococcales bacterium]|nr:MAG: NADH-quinone oxidoreductase subunit G [Micrococcales bacterium]PIE25807.1 MAG: NADH-quinone oxidoreductase subunit G [Micrococcales bacterium]